ncbi:MAG: hypothetical protein ABF913_07190 [Oenococcus sp.]|uniref:hypothetical protein n=1 Tax=Oenococcus sp. TaxID=1979414 RepID=UPI0039EA72F5
MEKTSKFQPVQYVKTVCQTALFVWLLIGLTVFLIQGQSTVSLNSAFVSFTIAFPLLFMRLDHSFQRLGKTKAGLIIFLCLYLPTEALAIFHIDHWALTLLSYAAVLVIWIILNLIVAFVRRAKAVS